MGTHHLWGNTTTYLWGHLTQWNIPLLGNMVREHRTYRDTPTIGKHHLRGHSTSEDTPSMGIILPGGTFLIWGTWYWNIGPMGTHQLS